MAGLQVDPSSLRNAAAGFVNEAEELAQVGVVDEGALAQDQEAHGEIYGKLRGVYRQARQSIADRFSANGDGRRTHAEKLNAAADGYEGVNSGLARQLSVTGTDGVPDEGSGLAPNGVGRIDDFQGGSTSPSRGVSGPYDTNSPSGPAQVRAPEVPGVGGDGPVRSEPAAVRPAGLAGR
ncbi:type VII secretion target [Mycobacteroides abscessus]|nr:type VII secretion target [Mycobacteroides abscessus]